MEHQVAIILDTDDVSATFMDVEHQVLVGVSLWLNKTRVPLYHYIKIYRSLLFISEDIFVLDTGVLCISKLLLFLSGQPSVFNFIFGVRAFLFVAFVFSLVLGRWAKEVCYVFLPLQFYSIDKNFTCLCQHHYKHILRVWIRDNCRNLVETALIGVRVQADIKTNVFLSQNSACSA